MKTLFRLLSFSIITLLVGSMFLAIPTQAGNFEIALEDGADTQTLGQGINLLERFETSFLGGSGLGEGGNNLRDFIARIAIEVLIPVFIFAGIFVAIVGFYKLMTGNTPEEINKASAYLLRGVVGIMIMLAASYLTDQLVGIGTGIGSNGIGGLISVITNGGSGGEVAGLIYDKLAFPFIRMFIFIILGVLFIFAMITGIKYIFSNDEATQKKSILSLVYASMGIIVIILAKTMVESVYGKYNEVRAQSITNLGEVGSGVFNNPNFMVLFTVINRILGLATFIIVIIIILQGYQLLVNPTNEERITSLKKNFGYVFIGILIIGAAYLLVNFFIVQ